MAEEKKLSGPDFAKGVSITDFADGDMVQGHANGEAVLVARRGDAYFAKGDKAAALREYRAARLAMGPAQASNDLLDLKINDLADAAPSTPVAAIPKGN